MEPILCPQHLQQSRLWGADAPGSHQRPRPAASCCNTSGNDLLTSLLTFTQLARARQSDEDRGTKGM